MDRPVFTEIKKLRTFVAIAEERSFTKAAERLNAAQPWVSDQLKQLEASLDLELIVRAKGKPIEITPAGEEVLRIARRLLLSCADASEDMQRCRDESLSRLVIGVEAPTLFIPERNRLIARFQQRAKGTRLLIMSCAPDELNEGLCNGQFDLILTSARRPNDAIEAFPFFECELLLAVPKTCVGDYRSARAGDLHGIRLMALRDSAHPWLPALIGRFRIVTFDIRGHGESIWNNPDSPLTLEDFRTDLLEREYVKPGSNPCNPTATTFTSSCQFPVSKGFAEFGLRLALSNTVQD